MKTWTRIVNLPDSVGQEVNIRGWVTAARDLGEIRFLDVLDQTGCVQAVLQKQDANIRREDHVAITGLVKRRMDTIEICVKSITRIASFSLQVSPLPHDSKVSDGSTGVDNLLANRHIYVRNPRFMSILKFRSKFFTVIHQWFRERGFIEIHCPILTEALLYDPSTAFSLDYFGREVYLTQCVAFYLEACVHAFDRVYNAGPSFRAEPSHGKRHLAEYWHLKAELAYSDLELLLQFVEDLMYSVSCRLCECAKEELESLNSPLLTADMTPPYERISYKEVIGLLDRKGFKVSLRRSLPPDAEEALSKQFSKPFFVVGMPTAIEPFPYVLDPSDPDVTMTADLHAPNNYGELLGVAEKIHNKADLEKRAILSGLSSEERDHLAWYFDLRDAACIPHGGMGMGIERTIRYLLGLSHVRDAIAFPRLFDRRPEP